MSNQTQRLLIRTLGVLLIGAWLPLTGCSKESTKVTVPEDAQPLSAPEATGPDSSSTRVNLPSE